MSRDARTRGARLALLSGLAATLAGCGPSLRGHVEDERYTAPSGWSIATPLPEGHYTVREWADGDQERIAFASRLPFDGALLAALLPPAPSGERWRGAADEEAWFATLFEQVDANEELTLVHATHVPELGGEGGPAWARVYASSREGVERIHLVLVRPVGPRGLGGLGGLGDPGRSGHALLTWGILTANVPWAAKAEDGRPPSAITRSWSELVDWSRSFAWGSS